MTLHTLRHTYAAMRVQTVERGPSSELVPVAMYTVARELGHTGVALLERTYGHVIGRRQRRLEVVQYISGTTEPAAGYQRS